MMVKLVGGALLFAGCLLAAAPARAQSPSPPACVQALGKARAERIVYHCMQLLGGMTHPPCTVHNNCPMLLEDIDSSCNQQGDAAGRIECQEGKGLLSLNDRAAIERYGAALAFDQTWAAKVPAKLKAVRAKLDPLIAQRTAASAALKAGQAAFGKELGAANAAYDGYKAALKKPGAIGVDTTRQALRAQLDALASHGQALAKDAAAIAALDARLSGLFGELHDTDAMVVFPVQDLKSAAEVVASMSSQLDELASKLQAEAMSKQKAAAALAASKAPDKPKLAAATREAALAKARSASALADVAAAKSINAQAVLTVKSVVALAADAERERAALLKLTGASAVSASASKLNQKLAQDRLRAQSRADEIEREVKAAAARHRPDAPKAKSCAMDQVDFKNFAYAPDFTNNAFDQYRNGQLVGGDWDDSMRPHIGDVQLVDLDGNSKQEAVVYIEGFPSAHSGNDNALHFYELDEQCRIQELLKLSGPVSSGEMKGKSYFYYELELGTPEGQAGLFPVGNQRVELRYINGELQEASRKNAPME
jgi:hypothetical protein